MSPPREPDAKRAFLRATEDELAVRRLERRLGQALRADPVLREQAARATTVSAPALSRIRSRLQRSRAPRRHWGAPALALAALALVAAGGLWLTRPLERRALDHVALTLDGEGHVGGTDELPEVQWTAGTLSARVTPEQGVQLAVATPEARVEVVGTVFTVDRHHHATAVQVSEGRVRVTCVGEPVRILGPGEQLRCLPADPASRLLRAAELARDGVPAADRLEAIAEALAVASPGSATRAELLAHRVRALSELGRADEAALAARDYLATGEPARRPELLAFVAQRRFEQEGCAASDALEASVTVAPAGPEALLLATCLLDGDPVRATALVRAAAPTAAGDWRSLADRLADRLGIAP